jgi:hypothetical protein
VKIRNIFFEQNETNGNAKTEVKDPSSNNYVLALANRSAAHVRLNQWEHAETDLSVILGNLDEYRKYKEVGDTYNLYPFGPHTTPAKLWDRRYNSLLALQRYDDAKDCLSICIDMLKGMAKCYIKKSGYSNCKTNLILLNKMHT